MSVFWGRRGDASMWRPEGGELYDDVIWQLPDFDPLDPPPNLDNAGVRKYTLLDGSVLDGTGPEWRIIRPGQPLYGRC